MESFSVKTPYNIRLDRWEMADFRSKVDFVNPYDAWAHAEKNLPKGIFVQICNNSGRLVAWGFIGCHIQMRATRNDEREEHA